MSGNSDMLIIINRFVNADPEVSFYVLGILGDLLRNNVLQGFIK